MKGALLAALSPIAFLQLAEESNKDDTVAELELLAASRNEIPKAIPDGATGMAGSCQKIYILLDGYILKPLATGFRCLHLVIIFVPVIAMVPIIWFGQGSHMPPRPRRPTPAAFRACPKSDLFLTKSIFAVLVVSLFTVIQNLPDPSLMI